MIIFNCDVNSIIEFGGFYNPSVGGVCKLSMPESYLKIFAQKVSWSALVLDQHHFFEGVLVLRIKRFLFFVADLSVFLACFNSICSELSSYDMLISRS